MGAHFRVNIFRSPDSTHLDDLIHLGKNHVYTERLKFVCEQCTISAIFQLLHMY